MANLANNANNTPTPTFKKRPWYIREKSTYIQYPIPKEIMWARLSETFRRGPVRKPLGIFEANATFDGRINGDNIEVQYRSAAKSAINYTVTGELIGLEGGFGVRLLISENILYRLAMAAATSFAMTLLFGFMMEFQGGTLAMFTLLFSAAAWVFFAGLTLFSDLIHRNAALSGTAEMLARIAEGNHYA